jgi:TolB-like protein
MNDKPSFFAELKRRNVLRAAVLYAGAVWALAQGLAQLLPLFGPYDWIARWFVVAGVIGFPFWLAFAWFYEFTPQGLKRESEIDPADSIARSTGRKLDFWIIGVLAVAVVLLLTDRLVLHKDGRKAITASAPAKSIAVLPFENLSADKDNAYFVAGMQDLILTKLADIGDLKVISRTSTEKYKSHPDNLKDIAQQLGVATLLEGSVQKAGNAVLINVQLIDAKTDDHVWAQSYQRTLDNIFGVEGEVAQKVADALQAKLTSAESASLADVPTTNQAAYDLFLHAEYQSNRGLADWDVHSLQTAIPLYRQAIAQDQGFALAYARASYAESMLAWIGSGDVDVKPLNAAARRDATHALALAPDQATTQIAIGYSDYYGDGDYVAASKAFDAALALKPNDADAHAGRGFVQFQQARIEDAITSFRQAFALDPRNAVRATEAGAACMWAYRYSEAEHWFQRALMLEPQAGIARILLARAILYGSGDIPRALSFTQERLERVDLLVYQRKYQAALSLLQDIPDTSDNFSVASGRSNALQQADLYWLMGDATKAKPLFERALAEARTQVDRRHDALPQTTAWLEFNIADAALGLGRVEDGLNAITRMQAALLGSKSREYEARFAISSAMLYAKAGRTDQAITLLVKVFHIPGMGVHYSPAMLQIDPAWDPIRSDPRFQALLKQYAKAPPANAASSGAAHE